ncbi:MAG: hypothetical protein M1833_000871 [Piccolia ochrophora]|nr:MAG: hypothetical protein M1833_000871 [Piccolia ochrophora]
MPDQFTVAILVVSDTAFEDRSSDKCGRILTDTIAKEGGGQWEVREIQIVRDSVVEIQRQVLLWTDHRTTTNLVLTTGGTGFAIKDNTPEAVSPLVHKHASGLVHGMLTASLAITPFAAMSRPVAGVRNQTLILTLPGSPKGAKENLQSVLKLLPHACLQAAGADSRTLHAGGLKRLEKEAGVAASDDDKRYSHGHHHDHSHSNNGHKGHQIPKAHTEQSSHPKSTDPNEGPSRRHRSSPYPIISVDEALKLILEHTPTPRPVKVTVDTSIVGSVIAEDVTALEEVPAFRASIVDGYAIVITSSSKGVFPVASVSHAAPGKAHYLQSGTVARITTGAPLPGGASAVVMVEDTALKSSSQDGTEEKEIEILTDDMKPGENVREAGSDIRKGEQVLKQGEEITSVGGELGLLASVGRGEVSVYSKPVIGVLSTGDEIINHDRPETLEHGEVRDTNRLTLLAALQGAGYATVDLGIARDRPGALEEVLRDALRKVDVIVTSGGVSMGELDLLKPTIERSLGGTIHFGRVAMKPGKPTTFATVPFKDNDGQRSSKLIFSLPGNPASAVVTLHLFVLPSLHTASGIKPAGLPKVPVYLDQDVQPDKSRPEYHRALITTGKDGLLHASSTGGQRSSRIGSLRSANGLLCLPASSERLLKGTRVEALLMGRMLTALD